MLHNKFQVSRLLTLSVLQRVFTMYGEGGHLVNLTKLFCFVVVLRPR